MADTSVKLSGTYDSIEAYNILEEMRNMSSDYEEIRTEAAAAASAATTASAAATNAVNVANTAVSNAQTYAGNANSSASDAANYAANADTSAANAAASETNASNSASAAATSAANAAASEAVVNGALPLSGGTMTGAITLNDGGNPLSTVGGTITGDLEVNGSITNNGNTVQSDLITTGTLTPLRGTLAYSYLNKNNRVVQCGGFLRNMTGSTANTWTSIVRIPEGFRPSGRLDFVMANNDTGWGIQAYVDTDGTVYAWAVSAITSVRWNVFYFVGI